MSPKFEQRTITFVPGQTKDACLSLWLELLRICVSSASKVPGHSEFDIV